MPRRFVAWSSVLVGLGAAHLGAAHPQTSVDPRSLAKVRKNVHETQVWAARNAEGGRRILEKLGASDAPALVAVLPRVEDSRTFALVADRLYELGVNAAIPVLFESLRRPMPPVVRGYGHPATLALERWGDRAIGPASRALGSDSLAVRTGAARVLASRARDVPQDARLLPAYRRLARSPDDALRLLGANSLAGYTVKANVDRNGGGAFPSSVKSLAALAELAALVRDDDDRISALAAGALHSVLVSRGVGKSTYPLEFDPYSASHEIGAYRSQLASGEPGVRLAALALLVYGDADGGEAYRALADPLPEIRLAMVRVLWPRGSAALASLVGLSTDPRADVRASVAMLLGRTFDPSALSCLSRLAKDGSPQVKHEAKSAILKIEGP